MSNFTSTWLKTSFFFKKKYFVDWQLHLKLQIVFHDFDVHVQKKNAFIKHLDNNLSLLLTVENSRFYNCDIFYHASDITKGETRRRL